MALSLPLRFMGMVRRFIIKTPILPKPQKPKEVITDDKAQASSGIFKAEPLKENASIAATMEELQAEPLTPEQEKQAQESLLEQGASITEQGAIAPNSEQATSAQGQPVIIAPKQGPISVLAPSLSH